VLSIVVMFVAEPPATNTVSNAPVSIVAVSDRRSVIPRSCDAVVVDVAAAQRHLRRRTDGQSACRPFRRRSSFRRRVTPVVAHERSRCRRRCGRRCRSRRLDETREARTHVNVNALLGLLEVRVVERDVETALDGHEPLTALTRDRQVDRVRHRVAVVHAGVVDGAFNENVLTQRRPADAVEATRRVALQLADLTSEPERMSARRRSAFDDDTLKANELMRRVERIAAAAEPERFSFAAANPEIFEERVPQTRPASRRR
jgi:hypothetical protein